MYNRNREQARSHRDCAWLDIQGFGDTANVARADWIPVAD